MHSASLVMIISTMYSAT